MAKKFTMDDMYRAQDMFWSLEYRDFYHKTFDETIVVYQADEKYIEKVRERAKAVLSKAPHYLLLKEHLFDFEPINDYKDEAFSWVTKGIANHTLEYSYDDIPMRLIYFCWFVSVRIDEGYRDDMYEFELDLDHIIYFVDDVKRGLIADNVLRRLKRELKRYWVAYRILCDAKRKLTEGIDLEYWYCEVEKRDPKNEWYCYYLPINLNLYRGIKRPDWESLMSAREKIRTK